MTLTRQQLTSLIADSPDLPRSIRLGLPAALAFLSKEQVAEFGEWVEKTLARLQAGDTEAILEEFRESGAFRILGALGIGEQSVIDGIRNDAEQLRRND